MILHYRAIYLHDVDIFFIFEIKKMATNLHALIRYRTINECLRRKGIICTWEYLAEACAHNIQEHMGIDKVPSRRTIMYDIEHMRSGKLGYSAPIKYDRRSKTFKYEDPNFSIHGAPLKGEELSELNNALLIIKQFSAQEQLTGINDIITKLEESLNIKQKEDNKEVIIQFNHSLNEPGQKWLNKIYQFILNKTCLNLQYQAFNKDQPSGRIFSPYLLKEFEGRWYVYGYDHNKKDIRCLGLDRIKGCIKSLAPFHKDPNFDSKTYTKDVIGVAVLKNEQKQKILFKANAQAAPYIRTNPIHHSQKPTSNPQEFTVELIPNFEFESIILKFGGQVEILKPKRLRNKIKKRLTEAIRAYQS
jgi:predicted DNA-binding transcriptional regulator YafY